MALLTSHRRAHGRCVAAAAIGAVMLAAVAAAPPTLVTRAATTTSTSVDNPCQRLVAGRFHCFVQLQHGGYRRDDNGSQPYSPADIVSAYQLPSASLGLGQTVAVVDFGADPNAEADLVQYRQHYALRQCTTANGCFHKFDLPGAAPDRDAATETSLDLDMVSATCPNCNVVLVETASDTAAQLFAGIDQAVAAGANVVSMSFGSTSEDRAELGDDRHFQARGVTFVAASGDSAYAGGVSYPASSPYVTAVGGTTLTHTPSTSRGWTEAAWYDPASGSGSGSGCSAFEPKPAWQHDPGCPRRMVADIAADADPHTGVAIYDTYQSDPVDCPGGWCQAGGTSASAPIVAGAEALSGGVGYGTGAQNLYTQPQTIYDVTTGTTSSTGCSPSYFCTAGPGYDGPTGLGTPLGALTPVPIPPQGYWLTAGDGGIFPFGNAQGFGSTGAIRLNQPIVGIATTANGRGYWLAARDGGIFPFGNAQGFGSTGGIKLNQPIVAVVATADGRGYWLVAADGGIFPFGDAQGFGSTGGIKLNQPIVGIAVTATGNGYWLVAADGGIFPFGDAQGFGSTGGIKLNKPIVGIGATRDAKGYWLVASDGGIFPFGDAQGYGSTGGIKLNKPIVALAVTPKGLGYWLVASDGGIFPFGDAGGWGSTGAMQLNQPIVDMAATPALS